MSKRSAAVNSTFPTLLARRRSIAWSRKRGLRIVRSSSRRSSTRTSQAPWLRNNRQTDPWAGCSRSIRVRCIHMGDIRELGNIVAGALAHPDQAGHGEYLPLVGDFMSFNEIVDTLNQQGHKFSYKQISKEVFAPLFPGGADVAAMFSYWQAHTYLGSDSSDRIALANKIAGRQPTKFATWARVNFPP